MKRMQSQDLEIGKIIFQTQDTKMNWLFAFYSVFLGRLTKETKSWGTRGHSTVHLDFHLFWG